MNSPNRLTDLLCQNTAAYEYFYSLPPAIQTALQTQSISSFQELRDAAATVSLDDRPKAF
jgi:hypothetical protein